MDPSVDSTLLKASGAKLVRLLLLGRRMADARGIDEFLEVLAVGLADVLMSERTTVYLHDREHGEIWSKVAMGLARGEIRLKVGQGIAGHVASTREILNIPEASKSPRFNPEVDQRTGFKTRSVLCAPMLDPERELVGVIEVFNKRGREFTIEDEELIKLFAGYCAVAVQSAILQERVRQRERLAAVGMLASSVVHDIKNVITLIKGYGEIVKWDPADAEIVGIINDEIDKLVEMTQEVLDFSRGEEPKLERTPVDVDRFLDEALRVIRREFEVYGLTLSVEPGGIGEAWLDPGKLRRAIFNIAHNARNALKRGGKLAVASERAGDGKFRLRFTDDGPGIPAEIRNRLFDPFVTAGKRGGTGLGLAITRRIIESHGGAIDVASETGRGTTVTFTLPIGAP